jgi:cystathionine gamma-synthase
MTTDPAGGDFPRSVGAGAGSLAPATVAVTAGRPPRSPDEPLNVPVVLASTYHQGGPVGYGREGNPTWAAFEQALGALEGGRAITFASGLAAVATVLDLVPGGGVVIAPRHAYSGSLALLADLEARGRLRVHLVDIADTLAVTVACRGAALVWVETPTNPALEIADLPAIAAAARAAGALLAVDNTFATPLIQRPLTAGADLVVHSATKYLSGHSDVLLGAVVATRDDLVEHAVTRRTLLGAIPGAMDAWLALRGLRTLPVRLDRAQANAGELARRLTGHPRAHRVRYPGLPTDPGHARATKAMNGFGAIVCVELADGAAAADRVVAACRLWVAATSLGGVESTLERRRRWPAESPGIPEGLLRLSVGIEDVEDLWRDMDQALRAAGSADPG